jgi:protein-S-isoprenylcysteine O-methyltransferase Ste14
VSGALRHLFAVAALPFVVTLVVPFFVLDPHFGVPATPLAWAAVALGAAFGAVGLTLFASSLRRFAVEGDGTLAPWDPPRRLVATGPYRRVRNPMISGVVFVLFAEALSLRSTAHGLYALAFLVLNAVYIPLFEEPGLVDRFGDDYRRYCANVPRFWPRLRPWDDRS